MIDARFLDLGRASLGPAMLFVIALATLRAREKAVKAEMASRSGGTRATHLWDLAERHHPEEAWLAESYLRGERSLDELTRTAPRGPLARTLLAAARPLIDATAERPGEAVYS